MREQEEKTELEEKSKIPQMAVVELAEEKIFSVPKKIVKSIRKLPLLLNLIVRVCSFLFLFLAILVLFFFIGNSQGFLPENLVLILNFTASTAIALFIFSLSGFIFTFYYISTKKNWRFLIGSAAFFLMMVTSTAMAVFSISIAVLSEGL